MLSSGINEREAMRKRLAAANAWATSANKRMDLAREMDKLSQQSLENEIRIVDNAKQMLATAMANHETAKMNRETAKKNIESAREDIENSQDEKKAAEAQLKEAEERSRVIDVDVLSPAAASPKRRKHSASPTDGPLAAVPQMIVAPAAAATASQSSRGIGDIRGAVDVPGDTAATRASHGNDSGGLVVAVVEGCGLPEVNGTYYEKGGISSYTTYRKSGQWDGKNCTFTITRPYTGVWGISVFGKRTPYRTLYHCYPSGKSETPPENGWSARDGGVLPAPSVRTVPSQFAKMIPERPLKAVNK